MLSAKEACVLTELAARKKLEREAEGLLEEIEALIRLAIAQEKPAYFIEVSAERFNNDACMRHLRDLGYSSNYKRRARTFCISWGGAKT